MVRAPTSVGTVSMIRPPPLEISTTAKVPASPAGTTTRGLALTLALPILNGGRGEVRVQNATREQLRAEFQARLDQTDAEVRGAERERASARHAAALLGQDVPQLERLTAPALAAYDRGDLDSQTYLTLSQNVLSKRADLNDKALAARLADIALETALFLPPAESRAAP
jgi:multidrug efflux system outer membrane protein